MVIFVELYCSIFIELENEQEIFRFDIAQLIDDQCPLIYELHRFGIYHPYLNIIGFLSNI